MLLFDLLAEQRIAEAIARGELDGLPGEGRPLDLDDDALVPEDLRMAYRILKNAGVVPPEVDSLRRIGELEHMLASAEPGAEKAAALRKLELLRMRATSTRGGRDLRIEDAYYDRLLDRLGRA